MSNKRNIIYPSDLIYLHSQIKAYLDEKCIFMLDKHGTSCTESSDFIDLCYKYIPFHKTDLSSHDYNVMSRNIYNDTNSYDSCNVSKNNDTHTDNDNDNDIEEWQVV